MASRGRTQDDSGSFLTFGGDPADPQLRPRETASRLALVLGIHVLVTKEAYDTGDMRKRMQIAGHKGFAKPRERIIIRSGYLAGPIPRAGHLGTPGATNMVRIAVLDGDSI
jgi:pyruvate kinase